MTEIERIINKGIISMDYLKEEIRNDFIVTTERKKVWAVILDLILEFDKICKKHNLRYYLDGGSLLGAIRHNGFIPWDDDFDVVMPRVDYEKFIQLGDEFKSPYFLQTPLSDPESFYSYAKLRNSNTTGIAEMFKYQNFNHGIWMTIFPLDKFSLDERCEDAYSKICQLTYDNSTYMRMKNPNLDEKNQLRVKNYSGRNPFNTYLEIQRLASQFNGEETDYWGTLTITIREFKRKALPRKAYEPTCYHRFENMELPIPFDFEKVLTLEYGDYMKLPSNEDRYGHDAIIFDAEKPYTEYV